MSLTIRGVLSSVRRTAAQLTVPRIQLQRPVTTSGSGQVLAPDGPVNQRDPQLDPFAEMALLIPSAAVPGYEGIPAVYDRAQHAYRHEYIHDRTLGLYVSAQPGLKRYKSTLLPGNPVPFRAASAGHTTPANDIDGFQERLNSGREFARSIAGGSTGVVGPIGPGNQSADPRLEPPKELVAYDWVVSQAGSGWSKHLILQNPKREDTITWLALNGPGKYTVRMRVFFTGNRFTEKTVSFSVREKFIIGIGDSFASGQGNPDKDADVSDANPFGGPICQATTASYATGLTPQVESSAIWAEEKVHRSFQTGQAMAALSLQDNYGETWNETPGPFPTNFAFTKVTFASFARSGATIRDGLLAPQGGSGDFVGAGQLEECRRTCIGRSIDALLISIGGNDAGFSGVLTDLVKGATYWTLSTGLAGTNPIEVRDKVDRLLGVGLPPGQKGGIEVDLETLRGAIDNLRHDVPVAEIYLSGYPVDLFYVKDSNGRLRFSACDIFHTKVGTLLSINDSDAAMLKSVGQTLNALLKRKAGEFGWHFVDVAPDFAGNGYCRSDADAMFVRAETKLLHAG